MENSGVILTAKERVERLAAGGGFSFTGISLIVFLFGRHPPVWSAIFLFIPFSAGIICFLQVRSHLCVFRGLTDPLYMKKVLILWLQALAGAGMITGLVLVILLKRPFINNI